MPEFSIEELEKLANEYQQSAELFASQAKEHQDLAMQNLGASYAIKELIKNIKEKENDSND